MIETSGDGVHGSQANTGNGLQAKSVLTKIAAFVADRNISFLVCSIGMIVMLLWAGKYKMTAPGAEGIIPLVSNSPLTSWQFKVFGPYTLGDMISSTLQSLHRYLCLSEMNSQLKTTDGLFGSPPVFVAVV
jgi:uncharacterized membrane protein YkgB